METRWSDFGFLGSLLLSAYGFVYFIAFHLSTALVGPLGASALMGFLGILAGLGGVFLSLGFLAFQLELDQSFAWVATLVGLISWGLQSCAHLLLAAYLPIGALVYSWAILALMFTYLLWGITFYSTRKKIVYKEQYTLFTGLLFLVNALGWLTYFGFALLTLASLLSSIIFVHPHRLFGSPSPARFFHQKRQYQLGQLGMILLSVYSILAIRWLVNCFFPFPVTAATALNVVSIICAWFGVLGTAIVFNSLGDRHRNPVFDYARIIGIPSLLILSLADLTWLMSNINVAVDFTWGLGLYLAAPTFWGWSALPLCLWAILAAIGFFQLFRAPKTKGDLWFLTLSILFLASGVLWLVELGYLPLIVAGILLFLMFRRQDRKA